MKVLEQGTAHLTPTYQVRCGKCASLLEIEPPDWEEPKTSYYDTYQDMVRAATAEARVNCSVCGHVMCKTDVVARGVRIKK
jgi:ribosomal protein S27E